MLRSALNYKNLFFQYKDNYSEKSNQPDNIGTMTDLYINNIITTYASYNNLDDKMKENVKKIFVSYIGKNDKIEQLQALINFGVNIDFEYDSYTPLMKAVILNDIYTIELLLKEHVDINKSLLIGKSTFTALKMALMNYQNYKKMDIIELLLQHGAKYGEEDLKIIVRLDMQKLFCKYINNATEEAKASPIFNNISFYDSSIYKEAEVGFNDFIKKVENNQKIKENKTINNDGGACYIATAVYGDYNCPQVMVLRSFRDNYLLNYKFGKVFVDYYYQHSPNLVRKFNKYKILNSIIKCSLDNFVRNINMFKLLINFILNLQT
jgi:hypothetical protein